MYYPIDKSEIIYLYDYQKEEVVQKFPSREDVLKFLAENTSKREFEREYRNEFLDNINMTGNDILTVFMWTRDDLDKMSQKSETYLRRYCFIDGNDATIDFRNDWKKIKKYYEEKKFDYVVLMKSKRKHRWHWRFWNDSYKPEFRKDPIPYTGKRRSRYFRTFSCVAEMRMNAAPEYKSFVRPKRNQNSLLRIGFWEDSRSRSKSKSWKDCTKKRHQYE